MNARVWHRQLAFWGPDLCSCTVSPGSPCPTTPASSEAAGGPRAAPGIRHLHGDGFQPWGWSPALLQPLWGRLWQPQGAATGSWDLGTVWVLGEAAQGQGALLGPSKLQHWMAWQYLILDIFWVSCSHSFQERLREKDMGRIQNLLAVLEYGKTQSSSLQFW